MCCPRRRWPPIQTSSRSASAASIRFANVVALACVSVSLPDMASATFAVTFFLNSLAFAPGGGVQYAAVRHRDALRLAVTHPALARASVSECAD